MVPGVGLEPTRILLRRILSPLRLPFPPPRLPTEVILQLLRRRFNWTGVKNHTEKEKEVLLPTKNATSQIYQNLTENRPIPNVGGRPKKDVPTNLIKELSGKDMGIKRIVRELQGQGIFLSPMTIQRVLSGESN